MVDVRILVVDDDESLRQVMAQVLTNEGYRVTAVASAEDALAVFAETPCDVAIVDMRLPGMGGLDLLKELKERYPDTQVIIVTSYASLESAVEALRAGAYDYLAKPFEDIALISAVVNRATEKIRLTRDNVKLVEDLKKSKEDLERMNETLRDLTIRDGLTGIHNHRYFQEFLAMELARSPRHDNRLSLLFLDIDHFKNYNDTHGHVEGDYLLCVFAMELAGRFRRMDLVARYGGEEFVVLLPDTGRREALRLAEELRRHIEEYPFSGRETQPGGRLTVSIGVASYPENGSDASTLGREADAALY
ncbi:MAG: diguanylate cyclase [Desulfuromonadales bacterium]|nr:MAG: diguanylate cyclase [Desulfuromonadales bacterium]